MRCGTCFGLGPFRCARFTWLGAVEDSINSCLSNMPISLIEI
jgi:hypothetical protein